MADTKTPAEVATRLVGELASMPGVIAADLSILVAHETGCTGSVATRAVAAAMAARTHP